MIGRSALLGVVLVVGGPLQARAQLIDLSPVINKVNQAISAASAARAAAEEVRKNMRDGAGALTGELQDLIDEATDEARRILADERGGRDAFLPGGQCAAACSAFRADLIDLLTSTQALSTAVFDAAGLDGDVSLSPVVAVVQAAPGKALYPIYRLLQGLVASDLPAHLTAGAAHLRVLEEVVLRDPPLAAAVPDVCQVVMSRASEVETATKAVGVAAFVVKLVALPFNVAGETEFEGYAAGWGFVGGTIKSNKWKKIADVLTKISEGMSKMSAMGDSKLSSCTLVAFQTDTRAALAAIDTAVSGIDLDVANLDAPVSSRATQASVDALGSSVREIQTGVSTLLDAGGIGADSSLLVRIQIERELAGKSTPMAVFYLPRSFGGLLETVRGVVEAGITQHEAAGFAADRAWKLLARGDAAMGQSNFERSYSFYQSAYQQLSARLQKPD
jgi:hypothetical protein